MHDQRDGLRRRGCRGPALSPVLRGGFNRLRTADGASGLHPSGCLALRPAAGSPAEFQSGQSDSRNGRWYDIDGTLKTAMTMLQNCPEATQSIIAKEMAKMVIDKIKEDDEGLE